ncbi:MAG: hypothetical protein SOW18_05290 [Peptoniphilus sp.]|nr:hypothetical protein [Peptoniphilus sp.]MDY3118932.1 hypothetical protein [Peptoniphilus sp.]
MDRSLDLKMAAYALLIGLLAAGLRSFLKPVIPNNISLTVGGILLVLALVLTVVELRGRLGMFYAVGENWKGSVLSNGGAITGVACFFLHTGRLNGFLCAAVLAAALFGLRRILFKAMSAE